MNGDEIPSSTKETLCDICPVRHGCDLNPNRYYLTWCNTYYNVIIAQNQMKIDERKRKREKRRKLKNHDILKQERGDNK